MDRFQQIRIPSFNLYGEVGDLPDVVHCEAIATRAALHNWTIKPHRHGRLHQFFLVQSGGGQYNLGGRDGRLRPPQVLNIPPRAVHSFSFDAGTDGWVVTVPQEVIEQVVGDNLRPYLNTPSETDPRPDLVDLFEQITGEFAVRLFDRAHILQAQIMLLAGQIVRDLVDKDQDGERKIGSPLIEQFEALLERHYGEHWAVGQYAEKLAVTPTHLSRVSRQHLGLSASKIIEERLIQEARRKLAYTSLTITDIAYQIGYTDPAYFSRVFTRATGMAPSAFRSRLDKGGSG